MSGTWYEVNPESWTQLDGSLQLIIPWDIMEQYFSDFDDNTSDYLSEGLMRSVITSSRIAVKNPQDYEARSNIMWTATHHQRVGSYQ